MEALAEVETEAEAAVGKKRTTQVVSASVSRQAKGGLARRAVQRWSGSDTVLSSIG
jgi:hypothetical protein